MTIIDKACWERGCPCHDIGDEGVEVVKREWVGLTDDEYEQFSEWTHIEIIERIVTTLKEKNT
jgi:hypothetical protein